MLCSQASVASTSKLSPARGVLCAVFALCCHRPVPLQLHPVHCPTRAQASCGLRVSCAAWVTARPSIRGECGRSKCSACFVALFWKSGVHACTGAAWLARADTGGGAGQSGRVHCSKSAIEAGSGQRHHLVYDQAKRIPGIKRPHLLHEQAAAAATGSAAAAAAATTGTPAIYTCAAAAAVLVT